MSVFIEFLGTWLADFYLLSTLLLASALLTMVAMRQPAHKLAVIRATIAGLFLLAGLCALPNWSSVHLSPVLPVERTGISPAEAAPIVERESTKSERPPDPALAPASHVLLAPSSDHEAETAPTPSNWTVFFAWAFLAGVVLIAARLALGAWQLGRLCREAEQAPKEILSLLERIAGTVALLPRLLVTGRLPSAVAMGVWDSTILIPRTLAEDSESAKLASVLAHELAHVKNGDLRVLAATRALMLLLWAHPLYWMLCVRIRLEQETLADSAAAELTGRHDYAAHLVNWAREMPATPHMALASAVGIWEGPSQLRRRVSVLLDDNLTLLRRCSRRWQLLAGSLGVIWALALSLLTLSPAAAEVDVAQPVEAEAELASDIVISEDYKKILGRWEVVSVNGSGGRFMDLDDKTEPGDLITIPHVRAPGPDYVGPTKVYMKSPMVTRWVRPEIERDWARNDSLHLYPDARPSRCTYKLKGGE